MLDTLRPASLNPSPDPLAIARLLWRDEALALVEERGAAKGLRSKPRLAIYRKLVEVFSLRELRDEVRSQLKSRERWRADAPRM
jgi:hypothetical protein